MTTSGKCVLNYCLLWTIYDGCDAKIHGRKYSTAATAVAAFKCHSFSIFSCLISVRLMYDVGAVHSLFDYQMHVLKIIDNKFPQCK